MYYHYNFSVNLKLFSMKRIKYLGIYIPKETIDLYIENYKILMKNQRGHK